LEIYEQVARASMDNNLLKFSVRNYLFNSFLCVLAKQDVVGAGRALDKYKDMDPTFQTQRECKLCDLFLKLVKILMLTLSHKLLPIMML